MRSIFTFVRYVSLSCAFMVVLNIIFTHYDAIDEYYINYLRVKKDVSYFIGHPQRFTHLLDCKAMFDGVDKEIEKGLKIPNSFLQTDDRIAEIAKDCSVLRSQGYVTKAVSKREESFPIAYSILMYKDIAQVEYLLRTIYRPQNVYCIHIDERASPEVLKKVGMIVKCFHNVFIVSEPVTIVYAGFSRLKADINCMRDVLHHNKKWKYFINLSGQMFPLKTNEEIVRVLEIYNGANDIEVVGLGSKFMDRFEQKYVEDITNSRRDLHKMPEKNPPLPYGLKYVKGSAYGVFSREFVRFILEDEKAAALLEWSKNTYSPDEMYWSTLHHVGYNPQLHTPGGYNGTQWKHPWLATYAAWCGVDPCYSRKCVHAICIPGLKDLNALSQRKEFTVNKLFVDFQPATSVCLAERLWNKTFTTLNETDFEYYRQLPFIMPK